MAFYCRRSCPKCCPRGGNYRTVQNTAYSGCRYPPQSSSSQDVVVDTPDITEKEDGIMVPPIQIPQESESANGVDKGTEQTIQPNTSEKPNYTEEELKNPEQKPNGDKVTENDKLQDHDKVEKPVTPPKTDNQPQGGDVNSKGETYLPGFG